MTIYKLEKQKNYIHIICYLFLGLGILFRLIHFFYNRGLWGDESMLVVNFINKDFYGLMSPLQYLQHAPIGFLWAQKLIVSLVGINEMSLRLFPLISGILSLIIFFIWAKYEVGSIGLLLAVGFFSFANPLIYHSVEAKQYSTEVLATVLAGFLYSSLSSKQNLKSNIIWAVGGASLIWFSFTVIFILVGIAITLTLLNLIRKNFQKLLKQSLIFGFWMLNFLANYFIFIRAGVLSEELKQYWISKDSFMPLSLHTFSSFSGFRTTFVWIRKTVFRFIEYPLGVNINELFVSSLFYQFLFFFIIVVFLLLLVLSYQQNRELSIILIIPVILVLTTSAMRIYPFFQRSVIFITPCIILILSMGVENITHILRIRRYTYILILLLFVIVFPLNISLSQAIYPKKILHYTEAREALHYIQSNTKSGEAVFIHHRLYSQYEFYSRLNKIHYHANLLSQEDVFARGNDKFLSNSKQGVHLYTGKKIWFILPKEVRPDSSNSEKIKMNEDELILKILNNYGSLQSQRDFIKESVYLYSF